MLSKHPLSAVWRPSGLFALQEDVSRDARLSMARLQRSARSRCFAQHQLSAREYSLNKTVWITERVNETKTSRKAVMLASPTHYQKRTARSVSVSSRFLRRLNMDTLAFVLFVALALLRTTHGRDSETRESVPAKTTKSEVVIDSLSFSPKTFTVPAGATDREDHR